jgi:uncharacterized membrane protein YqaE (UPF0057 family)
MPYVAAGDNPLLSRENEQTKRRISMNVIRIILALLIPPVAAFLTVGIGLHFWLNILLTIFFWVPGMIHALWLVVKNGGDEH